MRPYLLVFCLVAGLACHSDPVINNQLTIEATVFGVGGDCHMPLLNFGDRQNEVDQLVNSTNPYHLYYAFNLANQFQKPDTKLTVTVQKPTEFVACTTMGPGYQFVSIIKAEFR